VIAEYLRWGALQGGKGGRPWAPKHHLTRKAQLAWWQQRLQLVTLGDCVSLLPTVERALQDLAATGLSSQTVADYQRAVAAFCRWCWTREYLPTDPLARRTRLRASPRTTRRALTVDEIQQLLSACRPTFRLLYTTALLTGLRVGELRQLSLDH